MLITCSFSEALGYEGKKYSIANSQPEPRTYSQKSYLAPSWSLVCGVKNGMLTEERFRELYVNQLKGLNEVNRNNLEQDMKRAETEDVIYLCWESLGQFCHRHILADWLIGEGKIKEELCLRR